MDLRSRPAEQDGTLFGNRDQHSTNGRSKTSVFVGRGCGAAEPTPIMTAAAAAANRAFSSTSRRVLWITLPM